jgi:hypothetical protein
MKKLFFGLTLLIILIIGSVYSVLFTSFGNNIVASIIEDKVNESNKDVKFKVNKFILTTEKVDFDATISDNSKIKIDGIFSILEKSVDIKYDIDIKELSKLNSLTNQKLNGPIRTSGIVKGDQQLLLVNGKSDIANSDTKYDISMMNFEPSTAKFSIKDAKIDKLLHLVNQPIVAKGALTLDGNINNASMESLDGDVTLKIRNGKLKNKEFNKAYAQTITSNVFFKSDITALLLLNKVDIKSNFISSLAEIYANKTLINLKDNSIDSDYTINVKNLSLLQSIIGMKLNGGISTQGDISIKDKNISVVGNSNVVNSKTTYDLKVKDAKPQSLKVNIKNAKIDSLLHMLNQPVYTMGELNVDANISNLDLENLDGQIKTQINKAKLVNPVLNTLYDLKLKDKVSYNLTTNTKLAKTQAITKAVVNSSIANLLLNKAVFNLNTLSLNSDYKINVNDLSKLYDLSQMKMRGKIEVLGDISKDEKDLVVNGRSDLLNGNLKFKLKNDLLTAKLKSIEVLKFMYMMHYPEVFDSKGSFELDYNLVQQKGKLFGRLVDGTFVENEFSSLINNFARFDMTKEVYKTTDIYSNINKMIIKSTVNMKSNSSTIDVTQSTLDIPKNTIDALIAAKLKILSTKVKVKGKLNSPKISLVTDKNTVKETIKKSIDKKKDKLKENLKEVLKKQVDEEKAKDFINNFKSLF